MARAASGWSQEVPYWLQANARYGAGSPYAQRAMARSQADAQKVAALQKAHLLGALGMADGSPTRQRAEQYVAAGAPQISAQFAQQAAQNPDATQAFVNQVNLRDYLKLAGDQGSEQTAGLVSQGDPAGLAALSELRRRLGA